MFYLWHRNTYINNNSYALCVKLYKQTSLDLNLKLNTDIFNNNNIIIIGKTQHRLIEPIYAIGIASK
jgi:hypothetical protein